MKGKYPWLEQNDERRNVSDREILERYVYFTKSCLTNSEKTHVMGMLYKYKDAFSLGDEVGTSWNIEIDITGKSALFSRPYHVKEVFQLILVQLY